MDSILGLLLLAVYIVAVVGLAAAVTYAVIKIFPTERTPKKKDDGSTPSDGASGSEGGGSLFRKSKRPAT